jgi:hypothetical protein
MWRLAFGKLTADTNLVMFYSVAAQLFGGSGDGER